MPFAASRLPQSARNAPRCCASADWRDLLGALAFAQARFDEWQPCNILDRECLGWITQADQAVCDGYRIAGPRQGQAAPGTRALPPRDRCWSCGTGVDASSPLIALLRGPASGERVQSLHYWAHTSAAVKSHHEVRRLSLAEAHACINDAKARMNAILRRGWKSSVSRCCARLSRMPRRPPRVLLPERPRVRLRPRRARAAGRRVDRSGKSCSIPAASSGSGLWGVLLVLGLIIWLATLGVFKNAFVRPWCLGAANAAAPAVGWFLAGRTRYQTAGRALTLLACLVMPLNLWSDDAHNLITLAGHLWAAALVCCVLYATAHCAFVLRDQMFVYVLAGGVAMTGLLILAEQNKFWVVSVAGVAAGCAGTHCLHVERAFPEAEGPFSVRFGLGVLLVGGLPAGAGLLLVLGAQIAGDWLYRPLFEPFYRHWNLGPPRDCRGAPGPTAGPGSGDCGNLCLPPTPI